MSTQGVWNDDTWYEITIACACAGAVIFIPVIIWRCLLFIDRKRRQSETKRNEITIEELKNDHRDELTEFMLRNPEPKDKSCRSIQDEYEQINYKWNSRITLAKSCARKQRRRRDTVSCCRIYSASFYVVTWTSVIFLAAYRSSAETTPDGLPSFSLTLVAAAGLIFGVIFVSVESVVARERHYLKNLGSSVDVVERLATLRATPPVITLRAVAYHLEPRTRTVVTGSDSLGHVYSTVQSYEERIVTGRFAESFQFNHWRDESSELMTEEESSARRATLVTMDLVVMFGDVKTQTAFNAQDELFKAKYNNTDADVKFNDERTVEGFERHLVMYADPSRKKTWWIKKRYYWIATILFLSWPYRMMFNCATSRVSYTLVKSVRL